MRTPLTLAWALAPPALMEHLHRSDPTASWELRYSGAHTGFLLFPLRSHAAEAEPQQWVEDAGSGAVGCSSPLRLDQGAGRSKPGPMNTFLYCEHVNIPGRALQGILVMAGEVERLVSILYCFMCFADLFFTLCTLFSRFWGSDPIFTHC